MADRIRVSATELRRLWFTEEAEGMVDDYQARVRVVSMADGTEYDTPFDDLGGEP